MRWDCTVCLCGLYTSVVPLDWSHPQPPLWSSKREGGEREWEDCTVCLFISVVPLDCLQLISPPAPTSLLSEREGGERERDGVAWHLKKTSFDICLLRILPVRPSVRLSVCLSIGPPVSVKGRSKGRLTYGKIIETYFVTHVGMFLHTSTYVCVCVCVCVCVMQALST